jgi:plastocyanin
MDPGKTHKESCMSRENSISDGRRHYVSALPQFDPGRLGLLLVLLMTGLFYSLMKPAIGGERVIAVVEVKLSEFTIEMPRTASPGEVTFSVTNAGTMEHNFEVEGEGIEKAFDTNLKPGETRNLQVNLPVGIYTVYCPVDDHKKRGMQLELRIAEQRTRGSMTPDELAQLLSAFGRGESDERGRVQTGSFLGPRIGGVEAVH